MGDLSGLNFTEDDLKAFEEMGDGEYSPLPKGEYRIKMTEREIKQTKAGTGKYLKAKFMVVSGPFAFRSLWHNFNIQNPSEKAQSIGLGQLSQLSKAVGFAGIPDDSSHLLEIDVLADVKIKEASPSYKAGNEIVKFKPVPANEKLQVTPKADNSTGFEDLPDFLK